LPVSANYVFLALQRSRGKVRLIRKFNPVAHDNLLWTGAGRWTSSGATAARPWTAVEAALTRMVQRGRSGMELMAPRIPFNKPYISGKELHYMAQAVAGGQIAADGRFTQLCARLLENEFDIAKVLMTPSCTAALEMAAILCELGSGDEVILPSYTFVSTANAVARLGARPVFVDIRPDTLNIDESLIEGAITARTKAIFPVHYAGVSCEMDRIMDIAARHGLLVVEDAAQGVYGAYGDRPLGSIGHLAAYSFHDTKNYVCGEGGALCINAPEYVDRAEIIRDKGTNRGRFLREMADKYTWVDVGSSYVPNEIACAFLYAQLELLEPIAARRRAIYDFYRNQLSPLEARGWLRLPNIPDRCESNYHLFFILLPDRETRDALIAHLKHHDIVAAFHYVPLHSSPVGSKYGYHDGDLPVTEDLSGRLVRLPFYCEISETEQMEVISRINEFTTKKFGLRAAA
jgi:dTDP-4-amino-4,6-dideoxygalactose transaminase